MTTLETTTEVDDIAVQRAIEGDVNVRLSREDLREAYRRLREEELTNEAIADSLGVDRRTVVRWNATGGPTVGRLGDPNASKRWVPTQKETRPPAARAGGSIEELLLAAVAMNSTALQKAVERARAAIDRVRELHDEEKNKAAARAEVERLEAELAAAKARLRSGASLAIATTAASTEVLPAQTADQNTRAAVGVSYRDVKEWAIANGVDYPQRGRPSNELVERYRRATASHLVGADKSVNRTLEAKARTLAGWKGYITNVPGASAEFVIGAYHRLFEIERSFRMSKHDLAARPIYHHKRASIEAHLTIVFAALAVSRLVEDRTGWSIRRFVQTTRRYRTIQIRAGAQLLNAEDPIPDDLRDALTCISGPDGAH